MHDYLTDCANIAKILGFILSLYLAIHKHKRNDGSPAKSNRHIR